MTDHDFDRICRAAWNAYRREWEKVYGPAKFWWGFTETNDSTKRLVRAIVRYMLARAKPKRRKARAK